MLCVKEIAPFFVYYYNDCRCRIFYSLLLRLRISKRVRESCFIDVLCAAAHLHGGRLPDRPAAPCAGPEPPGASAHTPQTGFHSSARTSLGCSLGSRGYFVLRFFALFFLHFFSSLLYIPRRCVHASGCGHGVACRSRRPLNPQCFSPQQQRYLPHTKPGPGARRQTGR